MKFCGWGRFPVHEAEPRGSLGAEPGRHVFGALEQLEDEEAGQLAVLGEAGW